MKQFFAFVGKVIFSHVLTYFIAGATAYPLLTKQFYEGQNPIFATFMRTQADPVLWGHVMKWFLQGQILRGFLIAIVIYPFFSTLNNWRYIKRFLSISGLYIVLGFWAAAVPAPGTIEGMIYLRPEITTYVHLMVQPEILVQGSALGALIAWWMSKKKDKINTSNVNLKSEVE